MYQYKPRYKGLRPILNHPGRIPDIWRTLPGENLTTREVKYLFQNRTDILVRGDVVYRFIIKSIHNDFTVLGGKYGRYDEHGEEWTCYGKVSEEWTLNEYTFFSKVKQPKISDPEEKS